MTKTNQPPRNKTLSKTDSKKSTSSNHTPVLSEEINAAIGDYINLKSAIASTKVQFAQLQEKITKYMEQEGVERVFSDEGIIAQTLRRIKADIWMHLLWPQ